MVSVLYAVVIVFLFWVPAGIFLHGFYMTKYENPEDIKYHLSRDMRTWAPVLVVAMAFFIPETYLVSIAMIGIAFEGYMLYSDDVDGAFSRFKGYLDDDDE